MTKRPHTYKNINKNDNIHIREALKADGRTNEYYHLNQNNLSWSESWYIGNDLNDLGAIQKTQFSICPKDGVKAVKKEVDLKLKTKGGYGVLSELVTLIESSKI